MKKKYYVMVFSTDEKVIGKDYPQCYSYMKGVNPDDYGSFTDTHWIWIQNKFPEFIPVLDGLKLSGKSKLTDFISTCVLYLPIVNERSKDILSSFNLGHHEFYPTKIYVKGTERQFYFLYTASITDSEMILDKSKFGIFNREFQLKTSLISGFKTLDEYDKAYTENAIKRDSSELLIQEISVKKDFNLDYFVLRPFITYGYIVSERLLQAITENNLTGLKVEREIYVSCSD